MNDPKLYRRMVVSHEAWPAQYVGRDPEISLGLDSRDGGTDGEFGIRWREVGGERVPRLEVFDDGWGALANHFADLLAVLAELDDKNVTPEALAERIRALGVEDETEKYLQRQRPAMPLCSSCRQALPARIA